MREQQILLGRKWNEYQFIFVNDFLKGPLKVLLLSCRH